MNYGYARVSSITQKVDRQIEELQRFGIDLENIYIDKQSGKDFHRKEYQTIKRKLRKGDLLVIKSIDRLGRNYQMILEEWRYITDRIQADILVLDMPLLDTRIEERNLIGKVIGDIVLQILSYVAQSEREAIKQRQAEGIRIARLKGVHLGRPRRTLPENLETIIERYCSGEILLSTAIETLQISRGTFYKYYQLYKQKHLAQAN